MRRNCGLILDARPDFANTLNFELIFLLLIYGIVKCRMPKLHTVQASTRLEAKHGDHRQLCTIVIACNARDIIRCSSSSQHTKCAHTSNIPSRECV